MKFGQLTEYDRKIFLKKSYTKCNGEFIPRTFYKKSKLSILWINVVKFYSFFIICQVEGYRNILKLNCRPLATTTYKAFLKNKMRSETSLLGSFSAWFLKKNIYHVIFFYLIKFHCLFAFTSWDMTLSGYDVINFEINLSF